MAQKKADSPMADTILMIIESAKKVVVPSTNSKKPNRMLVAPARKVPYRKRLLDPMELINLPKMGEKTMVVTKTDPYT